MALEALTTGATQPVQLHEDKERSYPFPLSLVGALEKFSYEETTPTIGREYPSLNIVDDLLNASNADDLIRDLAITSKFDLI